MPLELPEARYIKLYARSAIILSAIFVPIYQRGTVNPPLRHDTACPPYTKRAKSPAEFNIPLTRCLTYGDSFAPHPQESRPGSPYASCV